MTTELTMLLASLGLYLLLSFLPMLRVLFAAGPAATMSSRDALPDFTAKQRRDERALANLGEALMIFAPLVLIAAHLGVESAMTRYGAEVFFGARLAHAIFYLAGVPYVKSASYIAGLVGMGMIASQLAPLAF